MSSIGPGSASYFADVSRELMEGADERPTLDTVVQRAVDVVPGCDSCSLTLRRRRNRTETVAASSELAARADQLQYDLEEGPCLEAAVASEPQVSHKLISSTHWPTWGPRVAEMGVHSVVSIQLSTTDKVLGALNFYGGQPDCFTPDDIDLAAIYATHATNALAAARLATGLRTALHSRHMIGVAQGILMQTYDLTMEQAFELLRRYSSHTNTKLGDVAEYVVGHRRLPDHESPSP
jgi:GAF domain-containing protein